MHLWVPIRLPGLNELIDAAKRNRYVYNKLKGDYQKHIALYALSQRIRSVPAGHFNYLFIEPNKRRDPSNVSAGGVKLIEDALVDSGVLENDGWRHVEGVTTFVHHSAGNLPAGAFLAVLPCPAMSMQSMIDRFATARQKGFHHDEQR